MDYLEIVQYCTEEIINLPPQSLPILLIDSLPHQYRIFEYSQ